MRKVSQQRDKTDEAEFEIQCNKVKKVTFNEREKAQHTEKQKDEYLTSSRKSERGRKSPRTRSTCVKSPEQAYFKSEKATQVQILLDRRGQIAFSDTERSTVETHPNHSGLARPARSLQNIGSSSFQFQGKAPLSPQPTRQCRNSEKRKLKNRMAQHRLSPRPVPAAYGKFPVEGPSPSVSRKESDESKRVFPFQPTPSGNLKIVPNQVVFESKKVSVLVADPKHTKVNVKAELGNKGSPDLDHTSAQAMNDSEGSHFDMRRGDGEFYQNDGGETDDTAEEPELELAKLGFKPSSSIDWNKVNLPNKSELFKLLHYRITNYINPDCVVHVGNEEFNCHHLVLQCYSSYFDKSYFKEAELPEKSVSPKAFTIIYDWMIHTGAESFRLLRRDNILEIFMAAQFLGIKELEEQCWAFIDSDEMFCEDTAFLLYLEAKKIGNTSVMELMIPRIMKFFLTLVSSKDFLELSVDELCIILKSNYICVHCEMEVFMSAVRWLMYNWEHRKKSLLEVMSCIRFGLVAPWQLVDIRRNPENPEFIEISSTSHVQQLIEDGLAFAIIKYWYGNQTQDYYHWIDLLGLTEPTPRNWLEEDKNYVTYRDFLRDLNVYRRTQMLEKKRSKTNKIRQFRGLESQALPSMAQRPMLPPDGSTIQSRPLGMLPPNLAALIPPSPHHQNSEVHKQQGEPPPPTVTQYLNCRDYVNKYPSSECTQRNSHTYPCRGEGDTEDYEETVTEMRSDDEVGVTLGSTDLEKQAQEVLRAQEKRKMAETDNKGMEQDKKPYPKKQEQHASYREVSTDSVEMREYLTTDSSGNNMNLLSKAQNPAPALLRSEVFQNRNNLHHVPVYSVTTDNIPRNMNPISASTIGLNTRSYLSEGSLFFADRESILVFGGIDPHSKYGMGRNKGIDIYRYLPDANTWEFIGELPEPRHHHSVAFFKGRVFLVGGADPRDDEERGKSIVVNTVWSYEPVTRSWFRETDMLSPRKNFGLVATNGKLFAIGGMDRQGRVLSSVERFDPVTGDWEEVAPLETGRMGLAATKFRDFIWVAGGMTACKKRPLSRNVERYDPQHNIWTSYTGLRFPRCFTCLSSMNDKLYLIGGAGRITERERTTRSVAAIDVWDTEKKQWCIHSEMTIPRHGHSIAYIGPQILIIGGVTTVYMRALSNVECFCCQRGIWIKGISNLPTTLTGHGSIALPPSSLI